MLVKDLNQELAPDEMTVLVSAMDFVCSILMLSFLYRFTQHIDSYVAETDDKNVTPADYTVFVQNLPVDVTRESVLTHFNSLYDLFQEDFVHRPCCKQSYKRNKRIAESQENLDAILMRQPEGFVSKGRHFIRSTAATVSFAPYTTDPEMFNGKFVADVHLVLPVGGVLRRVKKISALRARMHALSKKLSVLKKHEASEKRISQASESLAKLEEKALELEQAAISAKSTEVIGAFVTFNNEESYTRCLEDYSGSGSMLGSYFQSRNLRWEQTAPLKVSAAPEPSNIIWENLEITPNQRRAREFLSGCVMILLLLVSFAVVLAAKTAETNFKEGLPTSKSCNNDIPRALFHPADVPQDWKYTRDQVGNAAMCLPFGSEARIWVAAGTGSIPSFNITDPCRSPCSSPSTPQQQCSVLGSTLVYDPSVMLGCYCLQRLADVVAEEGIQDGPASLEAQEGDLCTTFGNDFISAQGLALGATVVAVIINALLSALLTAFTKFERHMTLSLETSAIASKVFIAQLLNSAIIVVLINANLPFVRNSGLSFIESLGLFSGDFASFDGMWYSVVGSTIMFTQFLETFVPHIAPVLRSVVVFKFQQRGALLAASSQSDLNRRYTPPRLNVGQRLPVVMKGIVVTMLFSSGMPILYVLSAGQLWFSYNLEKFMMLYVLARPPALDETLITSSVKQMHNWMLAHLALAVWMFGDSDIPGPTVVEQAISQGLDTPYEEVNQLRDAGQEDRAADLLNKKFEEDMSSWDGIGLTSRIVRSAAMPSFILLVLLSALRVLNILGVVPAVLKLLSGVLKVLTCNFVCAPCLRAQPVYRDEYNPPYSEQYYKLMDPTESVFLTAEEQDVGWIIVDDDFRGGNLKKRMRVWKESGTTHGVQHEEGDIMKTFEVISQSMVHTYSLVDNPKYAELGRVAALSAEELEAHLQDVRTFRRESQLSTASKPRSNTDVASDSNMLEWLNGQEEEEEEQQPSKLQSAVPDPANLPKQSDAASLDQTADGKSGIALALNDTRQSSERAVATSTTAVGTPGSPSPATVLPADARPAVALQKPNADFLLPQSSALHKKNGTECPSKEQPDSNSEVAEQSEPTATIAAAAAASGAPEVESKADS